MRWLCIAVATLTACSSGPSPSKLEPVSPPATGDGSTGSAGSALAPNDASHVDEAAARATSPAKSIGIHLRSSPSGAQAAVDGVVIGRTPTYWSGTADGRAHDFTFTLAEYEMARYHFVPVASGIVHARLIATSTTSRH